MNKNTKLKIAQLLTLLILVSLTACVNLTTTSISGTQCIPFTVHSGGSGSGCPGIYTGFAKITNGAGTFSITPPANATSGTLTDMSGYPSPYVSVASVVCSDFTPWCDTNSVTFPATNSKTYKLTVYVKNAQPPMTNGQPMTLDIQWH